MSLRLVTGWGGMQRFDFDFGTKEKSTLNVRCPECFKSYLIDSAEIHELRPRFECKSCQTRFWIAFPEALESPKGVIGFPLEWDAKQVQTVSDKTYQCPKCQSPYAAGDKECHKCGIVFLKFEEQQLLADRRKHEHLYSASPEVRQQWESVLENYDNKELHRNFVSAAWTDRSLDYAAHKYAEILAAMPQDEMAQFAQKEIRALTAARFDTVAAKEKSALSVWYERFNFFRDVDVSFRRFHWTTLIMLCCGVVIGLGMMLPHMRNLIGFGTSILFFILALRYYFRVI